MKTLAVIGHRDSLLSKYDIQKVRDYYISEIENYKPEKVITCLAPGADMELAKIALQESIPYDAYIPYRQYSNSFNKTLKEEYSLLMRGAKTINKSFDRFSPTKLRLHYRNVSALATGMLFVWDRSDGFVAKQIVSRNKETSLSIFDLISYNVLKL
jgi:hypothetical protein